MSDPTPEQIGRRALAQLEAAWNAADGRAFAAPFAEDADFVDIRGDRHRGREAIARGHQAILDTVYRGSRIAYALVQARALTPEVVLVHGRGDLTAPTGPLAGESSATATLVLARHGDDWRIAAFQNTALAPPR